MFGIHGLSNPAHDPDLKTTGGLLYYQYDGMRSVSEVTDRHGDIIEQYRYDAFGNIFTGTTNSYNFNGYTNMHYDWKTGLVNLNARWYNPSAGRFMSEDTYPGNLYQPQTLNRYSYVMNNPVNYWDPTGNVAELLYPEGEGFTGIPNWVRNFQQETITQNFGSYAYLDSWSPLSKEVKTGDTLLINTIQETRGYRQIYNQTQTTSWYYEYSRLTHYFDGDYAVPGDTYGPFKFQETIKREWEDFLSAEEVAKQNQQEIAKYGAPASARIIARSVTLPQQYSKAIQNQIQKQFKTVQPSNPTSKDLEELYAALAKQTINIPPSNSSLTYVVVDRFSYEGMRKVLGGNGTGTPDGLAPYVSFTVNFFVEDIATLVDPGATKGEWFLALGNTFIKPVKMVDKASDIAGNAKKAKNAADAKDSSENLTKDTGKNKPELAKPGEDLFVGTYNQSRYGNKKTGLNETHTPHHVVQDAVSQTTHGKGITINIRKDIHEQTETFGSKRDLNSPREHLAADIFEMRNLLKQNGYTNSTINTQLQELIRQNKATGGFDK